MLNKIFSCEIFLTNDGFNIFSVQLFYVTNSHYADVTFRFDYDAAEIQATSFPPLGECVEGGCLVLLLTNLSKFLLDSKFMWCLF